jgi:hypothetical protein
MSKQQFITEVSAIASQLSPEALAYFEEKSVVVKTAILQFLQANAGKSFNRKQIGDALYNSLEVDPELLLNDKDQVAYNSITAYANQLVTSGEITKDKVVAGIGKTRTEVVVYQA